MTTCSSPYYCLLVTDISVWFVASTCRNTCQWVRRFNY